MPKLGTGFQLIGDEYHYWFVVSEEKNGKVLALNVTDEKHCPDSPCKLNEGDQAEIKKPSVVFYKKAREFPAQELDKQIQSGERIRKLTDCPQETLKRMVDGAFKATDLTLKFLNYFQ
jgi:hypothetical protein